jgi:membrane-bound inhibitor of C-type lysozyme
MKTKRSTAALVNLLLFSLAAAGCGGISMPSGLWPFGEEKSLERSRVPPNSVTYQCAGGKRFYLRTLDNGAAAWVILPEREFRLDSVAGDATRYSNGRAVLIVNAQEASLNDGPTLSYTGCRIPSAEPPKPEAPAKK